MVHQNIHQQALSVRSRVCHFSSVFDHNVIVAASVLSWFFLWEMLGASSYSIMIYLYDFSMFLPSFSRSIVFLLIFLFIVFVNFFQLPYFHSCRHFPCFWLVPSAGGVFIIFFFPHWFYADFDKVWGTGFLQNAFKSLFKSCQASLLFAHHILFWHFLVWFLGPVSI